MTLLDKFSGSVKIDGKEERAYNMDGGGNNDMRALAELGTCKICDYFIIRDDTVILVEKTDIVAKKCELDKICSEWKNKKNADKFIDKLMRDENVLKVFGSLLVLCRLVFKYKDIKNIFHKNKYDFWLVDDKQRARPKGEEQAYDDFQNRLKQHLIGALTKNVIGKVLVVPHGRIKDNFPTQRESSKR